MICKNANIIKWLVFLTLFYGFGCDFVQEEEELILLTKPLLSHNSLNKSLSEFTRSSSSVSLYYEDITYKKFGKLFTADPFYYEQLELTKNPNLKNVTDITTQKDIKNEDENKSDSSIQCLWCFIDRGYMSDEKCYNGKVQTKIQCSEAGTCYTELHPQYIKRGCMMPNKMNRTFVCNCPLCNDKPANDSVYYQYKKIGDWDYHNKRIQIPIAGMQLICKVCETRGLNTIVDSNCRIGKNVDYMLCGRNQVCYVNIDEEADFISRGCIDTPAYNSLFYFCNSSLCNSKPFYIPKIRSEKLLLNDFSPKSAFSKNSGASTKRLSVFCMLAFLKNIFYYSNKL